MQPKKRSNYDTLRWCGGAITLIFMLFFVANPHYAHALSGVAELDPIKARGGPAELIGRVIKGILGITGSMALVVVVYSGFRWMLARGKSEILKEAQDTILWAMIGLAVIFASYAFVDFIIVNLAGAT